MRRRELLSKKTRTEFREFLVGWTLREIENEFSAAGLEPDRSYNPELGGQRREYVEQYYHAVDFGNPVHVERILSVYEAVLSQCETDLANPGAYGDPALLRRAYDKLRSCLRRDGYELEGGRLRAKGSVVLMGHLRTTASVLDADYLSVQVDRLAEAVEQDSDLAIGQAKELVETCCRTILSANGEVDHERLGVVPLVKRTMKCLRLLPEDIPQETKGTRTIKALLGNLAMISQGMAELRNLYGTGHGRHGKHKRLPARHARLAVGAATTLAVFLFETHFERVRRRISCQGWFRPILILRAACGGALGTCLAGAKRADLDLRRLQPHPTPRQRRRRPPLPRRSASSKHGPLRRRLARCRSA